MVNLLFGFCTFAWLFALGCAIALLVTGWPLSAVTMLALAVVVWILTWRATR